MYKNIIIGIFLLLLFQQCNQPKPAETMPAIEKTDNASIVTLTDAQFKHAGISTELPQKMTIGHVISLQGKTEIMPEHQITVSTPMSGFVRHLRLIPGMQVQKGQVLFRLEDKEYIQLQQDYLSAKNALMYARLDYERQAELAKNKAASDKILQSAEEKFRQQQITVTSLAEKLKLINLQPASVTSENIQSQIAIYAPVSGNITEVGVNNGKYVQAGENLIQMTANDGIKIVLKAFEKDLPFLRKGQKMVTYTNAEPGKKMPGTIEYIVNQVNEEGFATVIGKLENRSADLVPGLYMNVEVEARSMESLTVPDEAIIRYEGKEYVFTEKGNRSFEMTEIKPGQKESGRTQILNVESLTNQKIVQKGAYTLLMKMKNVSDE